MQFRPINIPGAYEIVLDPRGDERGRFTRLFCAEEFRRIGLSKPIVNVNHSFTKRKGTIRGLHFQYPPDCETKIIKCLKGAIWDCVVDIRKDSPTFLRWDALELTESNDRTIFVPEGFAHGFQALADDVELLYFHTNFYAPTAEGGLRFDDPILDVEWPLPPSTLSDRDRSFPLLDRQFQGISVT